MGLTPPGADALVKSGHAAREREMTVIAGEIIQADDGTFPVLHPTSEVAGRLAPLVAGSLLETLIRATPGVEPEGRAVPVVRSWHRL